MMRLVIREYLTSLKERGDLDAILPDLLTEMGFTVFSRPSIGPRQHGVDIGAVGVDTDGVRKVFLFSVKSGNLTRADWNNGTQALKPSLDEIKYAYLRSRLPVAYASLPIAICLTFGGGIDESIRTDVEGYIEENTTERIAYQQWNGDHLAKLIDEGPLGEGLMSGEVRAHLRKAAAMVEEPDVAMANFVRLVRLLAESAGDKLSDRLRCVRQFTLCLWILFGWGRLSDNLEAPYRASELALLQAWELLKDHLDKRGVGSEAAGLLIKALVEQQGAIWDEYYAKRVLPHVDSEHAISMAVASQSSTDINLRMFETIGRLALRGLWMVWAANGAGSAPQLIEDGEDAQAIDALGAALIALIRNNPALLSPIADHQVVDISLAITFLATRRKFRAAIGQWADKISDHAYFAYRIHGVYPTRHSSYWYLAAHPAHQTEEYRRESTEGSVLYPTLGIWAEALGRDDVINRLATFKAEELPHCNFQLFFIDWDSEDHLYLGGEPHGAVLCDVPIQSGERGTIWFTQRECEANSNYAALSAIRMEHWPILLTACRYHRLPLPPQLWANLLSVPAAVVSQTDPVNEDAGPATAMRVSLRQRQVILRLGGSRLALACGCDPSLLCVDLRTLGNIGAGKGTRSSVG
jgi:hypothetical protein